MAAKVLDVELTSAPESIALDGKFEAFVLVRVHGHPVGRVRIASATGELTRTALAAAISADPALADRIAGRTLLEHLLGPTLPVVPPDTSWSVAVCTRNRPEALQRCLKSIFDLDPAPADVIVVDNAPSSSASREVADELPVRYAVEPVPGLNGARRRAAAMASTDLLLFTDDDVAVDRHWGAALAGEFDDPLVAAATGLTMPLELETESQELFEARGGFGRGFDRKVADRSSTPPIRAGSLGAGASMAFRRSLIDELDLFGADIDCGTPTRSGGDTYALYRSLAAGYRVVYTPDALAWHQHRTDMAQLCDTLGGYSTGVLTGALRALVEHGDLGAIRVAYDRVRLHHLRHLRHSLLGKPGADPTEFVLAELKGALAAPSAYLRTRRR